MTVGFRSIAPIIDAATPQEARDKAFELGHDLIQRRLPWLMEAGRRKPTPDEPRNTVVTVGTPIQLHASWSHP